MFPLSFSLVQGEHLDHFVRFFLIFLYHSWVFAGARYETLSSAWKLILRSSHVLKWWYVFVVRRASLSFLSFPFTVSRTKVYTRLCHVLISRLIVAWYTTVYVFNLRHFSRNFRNITWHIFKRRPLSLPICLEACKRD